MKLPSSRLARATAAIILSLGLAYAALAQTAGPPKSAPPAEPRPTAGGKPLPNMDEVGRKQR